MLTFQEGLVFDLSETNNPQKRHEFNVLRIEREDGSGDRFNLYGHPAHQNGDVVVLVDFNTGAGVFTLSLP